VAKREIVAGDKPAVVKSPNASKAHSREFEQLTEFMIEQISRQYRNQVLLALNQGTVEKFADAQVGNYATIYLRLADKVRRKLLKRFDNERIEKISGEILGKVNTRNKAELYSRVARKIGISTTELTATEGLTYQINALTLETAQWIKKLRDETLELYTANSLRAMSLGQSLEDILEQFDGMVEKRKNHAKFTARNQIANFNSVTTKIRAQNLGITKARWITSNDERVRECHQVRNGKEFELDKGLYSACDGKYLLPGVDYQCRCDYELIIPAADGGG